MQVTQQAICRGTIAWLVAFRVYLAFPFRYLGLGGKSCRQADTALHHQDTLIIAPCLLIRIVWFRHKLRLLNPASLCKAARRNALCFSCLVSSL